MHIVPTRTDISDHSQNFTMPHVFLEESQQFYQEDKDSWGIPGIPTWKTKIPGKFLAILPGRPGFLVNSWQSYQENQDSWYFLPWFLN
jgi:hypothetical protein